MLTIAHLFSALFQPLPKIANPGQAFTRQVFAVAHHSNDIAKQQEILLLSRLQRVLFEERKNDLTKVLQFAYAKAHAIAVIAPDNATREEALDGMQNLHVALMLNDYEFRQHLHTSRHLAVRRDAYMKASFAIRETNDPVCSEIHLVELCQPEHQASEGSRAFTRVFPADCPRVRRIFTADHKIDEYQPAV